MKCEEIDCDRPQEWRSYCHMHGMRRYRRGEFGSGSKARGSLEERFWRKVSKTEQCWIWTGNRRPNGYGAIQEGAKGSRTLSAHRLSYEMHCGPIPDHHVVMHTCDNPSCVRPDHLLVGTYQENMDDMWAKGRGRPAVNLGEASGRAKLTDERVRFIRANPRMGHKEIADLWGLSPNAVRGVRIGRTWKHIE